MWTCNFSLIHLKKTNKKTNYSFNYEFFYQQTVARSILSYVWYVPCKPSWHVRFILLLFSLIIMMYSSMERISWLFWTGRSQKENMSGKSLSFYLVLLSVSLICRCKYDWNIAIHTCANANCSICRKSWMKSDYSIGLLVKISSIDNGIVWTKCIMKFRKKYKFIWIYKNNCHEY